MALYFQLTPKNQTEPEAFSQIDEKLCQHLGITPDPVKYYQQWYDTVGLMLAAGKSWQEIRETQVVDDEVIDYLESHYTPSNWFGR